jgi:two-component system, NtrC family, response regulator AtoC
VPPPKILVVDDDPDVRRVFATVLRTSYEVDEAAGGRAALEKLAATTYQLLLLDLHMPEVDGYAVLHALGERVARNHDIPVIVVTADGTDEARTRARRSRSVYFLSKPVPIRVLADLVRSTLDRATASRKSRPPRP